MNCDAITRQHFSNCPRTLCASMARSMAEYMREILQTIMWLMGSTRSLHTYQHTHTQPILLHTHTCANSHQHVDGVCASFCSIPERCTLSICRSAVVVAVATAIDVAIGCEHYADAIRRRIEALAKCRCSLIRFPISEGVGADLDAIGIQI